MRIYNYRVLKITILLTLLLGSICFMSITVQNWVAQQTNELLLVGLCNIPIIFSVFSLGPFIFGGLIITFRPERGEFTQQNFEFQLRRFPTALKNALLELIGLRPPP